jgi:hypothetical protein
MKTIKHTNELKSSKKQNQAGEALVMHTEGGEMPVAKKAHNRELINAESIFSSSSLDQKKAKKR